MKRILKCSLQGFYFLLSRRTEKYTANFSRLSKAIKIKNLWIYHATKHKQD